MMGLTKRQSDALRFIQGYREANYGRSPTYRKIAAGIGLQSTCAVHRLVHGLIERGALRHIPYRLSGVEVLEHVSIPRSPDGEPLYFVEVAG